MRWRVGSKVPLNVYDGADKPVCQCHTPEQAALIVRSVNSCLLASLIRNGAFKGAEAYFPEVKPAWACPGYGHHGHDCTTCTGCCESRKSQ
jgi:hypothetical protein